MNIDQTVFAIAGIMILSGLAVGSWLHPFGFLLTAFVGLNMFQAAFSGFCPLAKGLGKMGLPPGCAFNR